MDHRIALQSNTPLCLYNESGEAIRCVIKKEIGRGDSCIVYEAARKTDTGDETLYRVKEFYPYRLPISRDEHGSLIPAAKDREAFRQRQERFRSDFSRTNQLFYSGSNYAAMTNQLDIFRRNGTSYILSAYSSQETLAACRPESLKVCIMLVKQAAYVLGKIHQQGYLYLDIKPDNILVVDGYPKQIQLFDFDSLLSLQDLKKTRDWNCSDVRLSYSKGFAPIELQTSKVSRLGPWTDVYGIGALLFDLLFGYTPNAPDCETDAEYDFSKLQYDCSKCDGKLFGALRGFFHKTLAVYYADRYQTMQEVTERLQVIEKYADVTVPRIFSTKIARPRFFYGRERAFDQLDTLLADPAYHCLFITGMGGIGKSTFIREYLLRRREAFDTVLYVQYKDSIEAVISDDSKIEISTLRQGEEERAGVRYFDQKIQKIRELVRGTSSVLVIDNFTGTVDADLRAVLETELNVILVSRKAPSYQSSYEMKLSAISDMDALRCIFEANLGRTVLASEQDSFEQIAEHIGRHTLVLELIAKQIANSHITIASAAVLMAEHGFSAIAPEKVEYEKDCSLSIGTIGNMIDALFAANDLTAEKKAWMKTASLLGDRGMDIDQFQRILKLSSKDDLNELIKDGWLMISGDVISMHRVIQEAVHRWEWTQAFLDTAEQFLTYFYVEIRLESTKNNYPKKLQGQNKRMLPMQKGSDPFHKSGLRQQFRKGRERKTAQRVQENGLIETVMRERIARANDETPADIDKLASLLLQAEDILSQCRREAAIKSSDLYVDLLYVTVLNTPRYKEAYILNETHSIFSGGETDLVLKGPAEWLDESLSKNPAAIMQFYAMAVLIHGENERFAEAEKLLEEARRFAKRIHHHNVYALYYDMLSSYYDILLDGAYDTEDPGEVHLLDKLLDAIEKTLHHSKRGLSCDGNHLYAKNSLAKATILMRSGRGSDREIRKLIDTAQKIIEENTAQYADVRLHYYLVCAWYFALIHNSEKLTDMFVKEAWELSDITTPTDLQKIEEVMIPCANVFFELGAHEKSMELLCRGIRLCTDHANTDAYARIRQALCDHLWEVGIEAKQFALCQEVIQRIEAEDQEIVDPKNKVRIPEEVRSIIADGGS